MILCLCLGVSDGDIVNAIRCGARSIEDVSVRCAGAGSGCGACQPLIKEYLQGNGTGREARFEPAADHSRICWAR